MAENSNRMDFNLKARWAGVVSNRYECVYMHIHLLTACVSQLACDQAGINWKLPGSKLTQLDYN